MSKLTDLQIICKKCNRVLTTMEKILKDMEQRVIEEDSPMDLTYLSHCHVQCLNCGEVWGEVFLVMDEDLKEYARLGKVS